MNRILSLPVQELIRASERVMGFATNHKGLARRGLRGGLVFVLINSFMTSNRAARLLDRPLKSFKFVFSFVSSVGSFVTSKKLPMHPGPHNRLINKALGSIQPIAS